MLYCNNKGLNMKSKILILFLLILTIFCCRTVEKKNQKKNVNEKEKVTQNNEKNDNPKFLYEDNIVFERDNPNGININFYNNSDTIEIFCKIDNTGDFVRKKMLKNNNIHTINIQAKSVEFYLKNGNGELYNLGGVMGNYPSDPAENFRTSFENNWIKNNILLPYKPEEKPKDMIMILTVNLHTYQEKEQEKKFEIITRALSDLKPDIVLFQESAEHKESENAIEEHYGKIIRKYNMAKIISDSLKEKYSLDYKYFWDWSHYGWSVWEEGLAIMTKHDFVTCDSRYVTTNQTKNFWKSRNIIMSTISIKNIGNINFFSIHTGWWDDKPDPFQNQFDKIIEWEKAVKGNVMATILAGDFNVEAGSAGYKYIEDKGLYKDIYRSANPTGFYDATIGGKIDGWEKGNPEGKRIDYIFIDKNAPFEIITAQRIFTEKTYGRVSDHVGQFTVIKKR